jgi:hypothetical protein
MTSGRGRFVRDNAFLLAAASLPVLVVAFFLLATAIPRWTVPPPAYDLLVRVNDPYDHARPRVSVDYTVRDGRLEATVRLLPENGYAQPSSLWIFDHATMSARQVAFDPPQLAAGETERTVTVEALAGRRVAAESRAPDGYELYDRSRGGSGIFGELFGMRRYEQAVSIANRGRVVRIPLPGSRTYAYGVHFVGWIVE